MIETLVFFTFLYLINIKLRSFDGFEELNPLWRKLEKHFNYKLIYPLVAGIPLATFLLFYPSSALIFDVILITLIINDGLHLWRYLKTI